METLVKPQVAAQERKIIADIKAAVKELKRRGACPLRQGVLSGSSLRPGTDNFASS
jgi:hypothetical protein